MTYLAQLRATQKLSMNNTLYKETNRKFTLLTSKFCYCVAVEQELNALGLNYERYEVEDNPELARRFNIRHCPTLIVDEHRVIPIDEENAIQLRQMLTTE